MQVERGDFELAEHQKRSQDGRFLCEKQQQIPDRLADQSEAGVGVRIFHGERPNEPGNIDHIKSVPIPGELLESPLSIHLIAGAPLVE